MCLSFLQYPKNKLFQLNENSTLSLVVFVNAWCGYLFSIPAALWTPGDTLHCGARHQTPTTRIWMYIENGRQFNHVTLIRTHLRSSYCRKLLHAPLQDRCHSHEHIPSSGCLCNQKQDTTRSWMMKVEQKQTDKHADVCISMTWKWQRTCASENSNNVDQSPKMWEQRMTRETTLYDDKRTDSKA